MKKLKGEVDCLCLIMNVMKKEICEEIFSNNMKNIALIDSSGEAVSYYELMCSSIEMANKLEKNNCSKRVILYAGNTIEFVIGLLGIWLSGRTAVLSDIKVKRKEIEKIYQECESDTIVYSSLSDDTCLIAHNNLYPIRISWKQEWTTRPYNKIAMFFQTSGTTDYAKYVMLSMKGICEQCEENNKVNGRDKNTREIIIVPVTSTCGCLGQLVPILCSGGTAVLYKDSFNISKIRRIIREYKVGSLVCTSSILTLLLHSQQTTYDDLKTVNKIVCAGEASNISLFTFLRDKYGIPSVTQVYGLTETSGQVTGGALDTEAPDNSVGKVMRNFEIRIKEGEKIKGINELGEIQVKGNAVMQGYFRNEELTEKSYDGEWFKTGDIGYIDEKGYLYIVGRSKNIIIVSGKNVYPEEIEAILLKNSNIISAKVYSMPDSITGERIVADLMLKNEVKESLKNIEEFYKREMPQYMWPKKIRIVREQKISSAGKKTRISEE